MSRQKKSKARRGIFAPAQVTPAQYVPPQQQYPVPFQAPGTAGVPRAFRVSISVMPDPHATVATAELYGADGYVPLMTVTGSSKRDSADEYDEETGTALAVSRAVIKLGRQLGRQADGAVRHAESVRADRAEARARREALKREKREAEEQRELSPTGKQGPAELPRSGAIAQFFAENAGTEDKESEK